MKKVQSVPEIQVGLGAAFTPFPLLTATKYSVPVLLLYLCGVEYDAPVLSEQLNFGYL
jgi:hypothetical protein